MAHRFFTTAGRILLVLAIMFGYIPQASANHSQTMPGSNKTALSEHKSLQEQLSSNLPDPLAIGEANSPLSTFNPAKLPVSFVPNKGQSKDTNVKFQSSLRGGGIFFKQGEFHIVI